MCSVLISLDVYDKLGMACLAMKFSMLRVENYGHD